MALYERFGDLDGMTDDKITLLFVAFGFPFVLGVAISIMFTRSGSKFNDKISPLMLEELKDYKKKTGQK